MHGTRRPSCTSSSRARARLAANDTNLSGALHDIAALVQSRGVALEYDEWNGTPPDIMAQSSKQFFTVELPCVFLSLVDFQTLASPELEVDRAPDRVRRVCWRGARLLGADELGRVREGRSSRRRTS